MAVFVGLFSVVMMGLDIVVISVLGVVHVSQS